MVSRDAKVPIRGGWVDPAARRYERDGLSGTLSFREGLLLGRLAGSLDADVSREVLLAECWGGERDEDSRVVDATMARLRTKLERKPRAPAHLLTTHGVGYRFRAASRRVPVPGAAGIAVAILSDVGDTDAVHSVFAALGGSVHAGPDRVIAVWDGVPPDAKQVQGLLPGIAVGCAMGEATLFDGGVGGRAVHEAYRQALAHQRPGAPSLVEAVAGLVAVFPVVLCGPPGSGRDTLARQVQALVTTVERVAHPVHAGQLGTSGHPLPGAVDVPVRGLTLDAACTMWTAHTGQAADDDAKAIVRALDLLPGPIVVVARRARVVPLERLRAAVTADPLAAVGPLGHAWREAVGGLPTVFQNRLRAGEGPIGEAWVAEGLLRRGLVRLRPSDLVLEPLHLAAAAARR